MKGWIKMKNTLGDLNNHLQDWREEKRPWLKE